MADKFAAMEAFLAAVEEHGFSPAARKLGLAPSSVTRLVDQLEAALGTSLLNRSTRRISLTAAGEIYYGRARDTLRALAAVEEDIRDLDSEPRGLLRVAMPMALGRLRLMPLIYRFMKEYPAIRIETHLSDDPVDLTAMNIDVAIRIGELPKVSTLIAARLAPHKRHVVATAAYLSQFGTPQSPEDLRHHACLLFAYAETARSWRFVPETGGEPIDIPLNAVLCANNSEVLLDGVFHDLGLALLPDWLAGPYLRSRKLVPVLGEYEVNPHGKDVSIYTLYPEDRKTMRKVRLFVEYLKQFYEK